MCPPMASLEGGLSTDFVGEIRKKPVSRNTGLKRVVEHFKRNPIPSLFQAELAPFLVSAPSDAISPASNILLKYISVS